MIWNELNHVIKTNSSFLISSHLSPDGDSIGSQLAFYRFLKNMGKEVAVFCSDPVPEKFSFLTDTDKVHTKRPSVKFDVLIVLDCSNPDRLGWKGYSKAADQIINIDHHRDNTDFGNLNYVDTKAAATAEIIYRYFFDTGVNYPPFVSEALYTAIMTDTGGFRFENTSGRVLHICADLAQRGANCSAIYDHVYTSHTPKGLLLQARIWSTLKFYLKGKVCHMDMPLSLPAEIGAQYSDSEGMADNTITAKGVEVGIMTKHTSSETHFSLRSRGKIDVGRIAQKIPGGGGHSCAAGCTINLSREKAMEKMLNIIDKELQL